MDQFLTQKPVSSFFKKPVKKPLPEEDAALPKVNAVKEPLQTLTPIVSDDPFLSSTFSHKAPGDIWESYSNADNFKIASAMVNSSEGGRIAVASNMFEVRWGNEAKSDKMPFTPSTGIIQVNMKTGNTRVVRWNDDGASKLAATPKRSVDAKGGSSSSQDHTPAKKPKVVCPSTTSSDGSPAMILESSLSVSSSSLSPPVSSSGGGGGLVLDSSSQDIGPKVCCNWQEPKACEDWCTSLLAKVPEGGHIAIGLDCEWCAPWWAKSFGDAIQTIQLYNPAVGSLVYSTGCGDEKNKNSSKLPKALEQVFAHKSILKVGVNVHGDTCRIANTFQCNVLSAYNLMNKTSSGIKRSSSAPLSSSSSSSSKTKKSGGGSLESMSQDHCPAFMQLDKKSDGSKVRMGDWSVWPLSEDQQHYAAMDAVVSFWIFSSLMGVAYPNLNLNINVKSLDLKNADPDSTSSSLKRAASVPNDDPNNSGVGDAGEEDKVSGVSLKAAANAAFFMMHRNKSIKPPQAGVKEHPQGPPNCLKGYVAVVSGVLDSFSRKEFEAYVTSHGGSVVKGISKKITHLVNDHGEIGPSKKAKCLEMKVDIVGEDFFIDKVKAAIQG